jgi:segregation and condensation protein B
MKPSLPTLIEALLFVSQDPVSLERLIEALPEDSPEDIEKALEELREGYASRGDGIRINRSAGGWMFETVPELDPWIRRFLRQDRRGRLSPAALETLSSIAYHQPVTLAEISALRGVDSTHSLKTLLQKKLVKITGRRHSPGKPLIYRTTQRFLTYFGLDSLKDLPSQEEIAKILDEEKARETADSQEE